MTRIDLIKMEGARVARISLAPGEISPNHYHTEVVENVVCLAGKLEIRFDDSSKTEVLVPGNIYEIKPEEPHFLINLCDSTSEYLLVQKGAYDFVPAQ
ncbi:Cupin domain-containing protein [Amphritea atlantica]|uniref:Cupin domain-containing protein n=1 Tax=Amphritea atlantica TaxID=355243 RepID=A0A1H9KTJ1_9GAMM|nr:cupin domain-containing protein [Amphritea atlantica]SER02506.1 Cupin domain-containing protein [Amphritea atlantica]